jgi:hypothetical protein
MFRPLTYALFSLAAALLVAVGPAEAQRRSDDSRSERNRDRDRDRNRREFADLVVERIREGRDEVRVSVKNVGEARSPASRLVVVVIAPGQGRRTFFAEVPPLRPGQDRNVRVETNIRPDRRGTEIIAVADFFGDVRERNERNNTLRRFVN